MDARTAALQLRTLEFGIRIVRLARKYPQTPAAEVVARGLVKAATAVGANYHAACRTQTAAEVAARLSAAGTEAAESAFWLALTRQADMITGPSVTELYDEAHELAEILADSSLTVTHHT